MANCGSLRGAVIGWDRAAALALWSGAGNRATRDGRTPPLHRSRDGHQTQRTDGIRALVATSGRQCPLHDLRILVDQRQQHPRWSLRAAAALLPVQKRALFYPDAAREFRLRETRPGTDRLYIQLLAARISWTVPGRACPASMGQLLLQTRFNAFECITHLMYLPVTLPAGPRPVV